MNREKIREALESASASLEMVIQELDNANWKGMQDWEKRFHSEAWQDTSQAQSRIDGLMAELEKLPR